jgi:hypothetical protein
MIMREILELIERKFSVPSEIKAAAKHKNFKGLNENEAIAYQWIWKWDLVFSKAEDGLIDAKVSDWDNSLRCSICNRKIVHVYWVKKKENDDIVPVGGDHLHILLGYPREFGKRQLDSIRKKVIDLEMHRREEKGLRKRYDQIIAQREADTLGDANKNLMICVRKLGIQLPKIGSEVPEKMWLINNKKRKVMRSAGLAVDRFLSMYPDWNVTKNVGEVIRMWGKK